MPAEPSELAAALPPEVLATALAAMADAPGARDEALAAVCAAHPDHAATLRRLLADLSAVERLLDGGDGPADETPLQIGQYRVVRRLGGGAFGEVFLCEQQEPVRREVAVKLLRAGAGDRTTLLRFATERQLVASLQHPAIAQVFDAGTLADGRPFFVMDAIDGTPLDRYCDEHALTVEARIELFCDLCRGVQHAHERGIVHRDLKPANVLVVEIDGRPRPKVIDFGIAKVLHGSRVPRSFDTEAGRIVGTPGYMSPEQQSGASEDVDARADVFCLGVMLYELLCGQLPWSAGAADTDTDPQRPSTRVSGSAPATAIARRRSTESRRLASRLRGDLDWIALKCLQRERDQRYQSAQELIDDLERHRRAEPVRAGPPSTAYRLRKYVRRHRTALTVLGSVAVVATAGLVLAQWYHRSASDQIGAATARADASFADAAAAVALLVERANDPAVREAPQGDAARESMLRDALSFYDRFLNERPADATLRAERCRALLGLSHMYSLLGDAERATAAAQAAMQESEALYAHEPLSIQFRGLLGEALCRHGVARSVAGDKAGALVSFTAAVGHLEPSASALPARFGCLLVRALRNAAVMLPQHSQPERLQGLRATMRVLDGLRSTEAPVPALAHEHVVTACALGQDLRIAHELAEAEAVLQQAGAQLELVTDDRLHLAYRVSTLRADVAFQGGGRRSTLVHYEEALAAATAWEQAQPRRLLPRTTRANALRNLAYAQNYAGEFAASLESFRQAIAIGEALIGQFPMDPTRTSDLIVMLENVALTLFDRYRQSVLAEAAACAERAVTLGAGSEASPVSPRRWIHLGLQAAIADARMAGGGDRHWPAVEAALLVDPKPVGRAKDALLGVFAGLLRWHIDHGRGVEARAVLAKADAWIALDPAYHSKRTVEIGWQTARLAAANDDHGACASAADRVLAARSTWHARRRAADCLHLGWRCAADDPAAAAAAAGYRDRALDLYRQVRNALDGDVEKDPTDPWFVLPWALAGVRAAELTAAAEPAAALELLVSSLKHLDAVRDDAHADQWDEPAYRDGRALHEKLAAAGR